MALYTVLSVDLMRTVVFNELRRYAWAKLVQRNHCCDLPYARATSGSVHCAASLTRPVRGSSFFMILLAFPAIGGPEKWAAMAP